nr:hypothetical protein [Tanacetum cinerariifolium]
MKCTTTLMKTSSATSTGREIERSVSSRVIHVGYKSGRESLFYTGNGIRLMLAPRSARAKHSAILGKSHGIRNLSGSLSFSSTFFRRTAEQCAFNGVLAISQSLSFLVNKLLMDGPNFGIKIRASAKLILKFKSLKIWKNFSQKMVDENVLAPAPTRSDDQIHPFAAWVPIGKSNFLGYIEVIHFMSRMAVNNLYQPWRVILSMINQCLTGKTSGHNRPRYPVLQMLWGIITSTNVDYAKLLWEEFVQAIQTFLTDKENMSSPTKKGRKDKPHVIPYGRFMKIIICHLGRIHNIHQRSASPFHLAEEDFRLGNLKFVPKGEIDEVFEMLIPDELISNDIRNAPYYNAYLEMVAKHDQKMLAEKEGTKKTNTNFFKAFIASASVPSIYIQQFWNTLTYEAKTRAYSF